MAQTAGTDALIEWDHISLQTGRRSQSCQSEQQLVVGSIETSLEAPKLSFGVSYIKFSLDEGVLGRVQASSQCKIICTIYFKS